MANGKLATALAFLALLQLASCSLSVDTPAMMTVNSFQRGESACDGQSHDDGERVVALSNGWLRLDGTQRCNRMIRVTSAGGQSVLAKVVDECGGCDDNYMDSSPAVWRALGLDTDVGRVRVTWSDA